MLNNIPVGTDGFDRYIESGCQAAVSGRICGKKSGTARFVWFIRVLSLYIKEIGLFLNITENKENNLKGRQSK